MYNTNFKENSIYYISQAYFFNGYYTKNINSYLELNNAEKLIEEIPEYLIEDPIFSIIIPFTNNSKTLRRTIRSIQNQSFKSYEILFVNDKSSDNSSLIIKQFSVDDKRFKILKNKESYGAFFSRVIGMQFSKGKLIYHFDGDDMFAISTALENLYNISKTSKVDTIEFNLIYGKIKCYSTILVTVNSKKDRNKIFAGREIFNKRYLINNKTINRVSQGAICSKLFTDKIKNRIINYLRAMGLSQYKNWNYADDQFFTDLIKLFSDNYLYIDSIYYFYYLNPESLCNKINQTKLFVDHMKYFYYFNILTKQYKLNIDFLITNVVMFLNMISNISKNDCIKLYDFIIEIRINRTKTTEYWKDNSKLLTNKYKDLCNK